MGRYVTLWETRRFAIFSLYFLGGVEKTPFFFFFYFACVWLLVGIYIIYSLRVCLSVARPLLSLASSMMMGMGMARRCPLHSTVVL